MSEAPTAEFTDASLTVALAEICRSDEGRGEIEVRLAERLSEDQQRRLSALIVGPEIDDPKEARKLLAGYIGALERARRQREIAEAKRGVTSSDTKESIAALKSVIEAGRAEHGGE